MFKILIAGESKFPVRRKILRQVAGDFLGEQRVKSEVEVSIAIVGDRKMKALNKRYREKEETTPVLTFSLSDPGSEHGYETGKWITPDGVLRLGDIVISYPQAVNLARTENKLVDTVLAEFIVHGLKNLLGLT